MVAFRLEWQDGVIAKETKRPAKPKICTIWPVIEKACRPSSKPILILLSLAFPGYSPVGSAQVTMKCKQRSAGGVLEKLCFLHKGWHLNSPSGLEYEREIWMWEQPSCNCGVMNIKVKTNTPEERKGPVFQVKFLSSSTKANTCDCQAFCFVRSSIPVCEAVFICFSPL